MILLELILTRHKRNGHLTVRKPLSFDDGF